MIESGSKFEQLLYWSLRYLADLLLKLNFSTKSFVEVSKRAYVHAAEAQCKAAGYKPSVARIQRMTGLSKRDVYRVRTNESPDQSTAIKDGPMSQPEVLRKWYTDNKYTDDYGNPRELALFGDDDSISALILDYSESAQPERVIESLRLNKSIIRTKSGRFLPTRRWWSGSDSVSAAEVMLNSGLLRMCNVLSHNYGRNTEDAWVQRTVYSAPVSAEHVNVIRRSIKSRCQEFTESIDDYIDGHADPDRDISDLPRRRVGCGVFYFEEDIG